MKMENSRYSANRVKQLPKQTYASSACVLFLPEKYNPLPQPTLNSLVIR